MNDKSKGFVSIATGIVEFFLIYGKRAYGYFETLLFALLWIVLKVQFWDF